ncbi:MAG TPA: hypothetical protein VHS07_00060, partial [Candidatus Binataceae bacterium]|nr:hypothetical protein [Candidatus Binataceae bacterium]
MIVREIFAVRRLGAPTQAAEASGEAAAQQGQGAERAAKSKIREGRIKDGRHEGIQSAGDYGFSHQWRQ